MVPVFRVEDVVDRQRQRVQLAAGQEPIAGRDDADGVAAGRLLEITGAVLLRRESDATAAEGARPLVTELESAVKGRDERRILRRRNEGGVDVRWRERKDGDRRP